MTIYCDNQSAVNLMKYPIFHECSKHIDIELHFIRDKINKINIDLNLADASMKSLPIAKFKLFFLFSGMSGV